jgi:hypothetical protein
LKLWWFLNMVVFLHMLAESRWRFVTSKTSSAQLEFDCIVAFIAEDKFMFLFIAFFLSGVIMFFLCRPKNLEDISGIICIQVTQLYFHSATNV